MSSSQTPAVIYIIKCKDATKNISYVGSTLNYKARIRTHKNDFINSNRKLYKEMRQNGGLDNFQSSILCVIPRWTNASEYREVEKSFIKELKPTCNKNIPNRTCKSWQKSHPERQRIYNERYKMKYPEKVKQCIKRWSEKNRVISNEKAKVFYKKNRTLICAKMNKKIGCICGCVSNYSHIRYGTHRHNKKHNTLSVLNIQNAKSKLKSNSLNINVLE